MITGLQIYRNVHRKGRNPAGEKLRILTFSLAMKETRVAKGIQKKNMFTSAARSDESKKCTDRQDLVDQILVGPDFV
jgi:hypothetical protein